MEELFATNHLKMGDELRQEIDDKLNCLKDDPAKLEIVYNVIKGLLKE